MVHLNGYEGFNFEEPCTLYIRDDVKYNLQISLVKKEL